MSSNTGSELPVRSRHNFRMRHWLTLVAVMMSLLLVADLARRFIKFFGKQLSLTESGWQVVRETSIPAACFPAIELSLPIKMSTGFGMFGATEATFHHLNGGRDFVHFDDSDIETVCSLPGLQFLRVTCHGRGLSRRVCQQIAMTPDLAILQLDDCTFPDGGLKAIVGNPSIQTLSLSNLSITDVDVESIVTSESLREFRILRVEMSDAAAMRLSSGKAQCKLVFMGGNRSQFEIRGSVPFTL